MSCWSSYCRTFLKGKSLGSGLTVSLATLSLQPRLPNKTDSVVDIQVCGKAKLCSSMLNFILCRTVHLDAPFNIRTLQARGADLPLRAEKGHRASRSAAGQMASLPHRWANGGPAKVLRRPDTSKPSSRLSWERPSPSEWQVSTLQTK